MIIKQIDFILENCEIVSIPGYYIGFIDINDIKTNISRVACNCVMEMRVCNDFAIEIHRDANKKYAPFDIDDPERITSTFDRLTKWRDITSIELTLTDNEYCEEDFDEHTDSIFSETIETHKIFLHWIGDSEFENAGQLCYINKSGDLYITVNDGTKSMYDVFGKEIDDPECVDLHFELMDVGDDNHQIFLERMKRNSD